MNNWADVVDEQYANILKSLGDTDFSPKGELKQRLNLQQKGIDPGKPLNWRGL